MTQKQREPLMDAIQRRLKERVAERARLAKQKAERFKLDRQREETVAAQFKDWLEERENVILPDDITTSASVMDDEEDCFAVFVDVSDDAWITWGGHVRLSPDEQASFTPDQPTWTVSLGCHDVSGQELFLDAMIVALGLEDEDEAQ
jgi:hypothetical protein